MADVAQLGIGVDTSQVTAAVLTLDDLNNSAKETKAAIGGIEAAAQDTGRALVTATTGANRSAVALREVGATAVVVAEKTNRAGNEVRELGTKAAAAGRQAQQGGVGFRAMAQDVAVADAAARRFDTRGLMMQLSQVGQMAMATGNPVQALAIQLPDIGLAFGAVGTAVGLAAGLMLPFAANLLGISDNADEAEASTDAFAASIERYRSYAQLAAGDTLQLREEFGAYADDVQKRAEQMLRITAQAAVGQVAGVSTGIRESLAEGIGLLEEYNRRVEQMARTEIQVSQGVATTSDIVAVRDLLAMAEEDLAAFTNATGISADQIAAFSTAISALRDNTGQSLPEIRDEMQAVFVQMEAMTNSGVQQSEEFYEALYALEDAITMLEGAAADAADVGVAQLKRQLGEAWQSAGDFASSVLNAATNVNVLDESSLSGIWSGFDGLIDRARAFLGLTNDIIGVTGAGISLPGPGQYGGGPVAGGVTAEAVVQGLMARGLPQHIAQGFAANFKVESNFNPSNTTGDGGRAWGLAQWNDRRDDLLAFAEAQGKAWDDFNLQLDFVMHELRGTESRAWNGTSAVRGISSARNAEEAARLVSVLYERPGTPHLDRRLAAAREYQSLGLGSGAGWVGNEFNGPRPPTRGIDGAYQEWEGARPSARPMDLGNPLLAAPGRPRSRPMDLDLEHIAEAAEKTDELRSAVESLIATYDPAADRAQLFEQAQKDVNEAVKEGIYTQQEGDAILAAYSSHLLATSEEAVAAIEAQKAATEQLKGLWQEFGDTVGQVFADIIVRGEDWRASLSNLFASIASDLISSGISDLIMSAFGGGFKGSGSIGDTVLSALAPRTGITTWAGGGYTGDAPRSGGLDGQGGFLALLHPQEDIYDRTQGQSAGSQVIEINVIGATTNREIKQMVESGIQSGLARSNKALPDRINHIARDRRVR